jgi:peptidase A4-like protein
MSIIDNDPRLQETTSVVEPAYLPPPYRASTRRRRSRRGALIIAIAAVVLILGGLAVAVLPPSAPGHQFLSNFGSNTSSTSSTIQQVIQTANSEQVQALAANNTNMMEDTATAAYYRQLVQIQQQMVAQGVTAIQLTNLSWGPISISGSTATATDSETWVTTYSDGTTSESTDTNVYTLVQQNGTWLIESDQQPTSSAPSTTPAAAAPPQPTPVPVVGSAAGVTSHNWSGYATTGGTFTGVTGTWTIPQPSSSTSTGVGATWVGIGGVTSQDLIQAGTQDVSSGGQHQFQTWIEMLPAASQQVPLAVSPGDSVTVSITESAPGSGQWSIVMKNNTTGQNYQTTAQYQSSQSSAEWIEEAPANVSGNSTVIEPLDAFGSIPFSGATAVENGQTVELVQAGVQAITMLNSAGQALAVPSAIGSNGTSFTVTRTSAQATTTPVGRTGGQRGRGRPPATGR